ncbi:MAG: NAD(P)H-hydrate dehydratase [Eggerthellaceae bacterium]|nr:NAD(P)H-hydrate dehydratase [Eggerthellaceae bacterium]
MTSKHMNAERAHIVSSFAEVAKYLPWPKPDTDKYSRGKCVVIAGSPAYPGAAVLSCIAAQRSGAGYVELYTHSQNVDKIQMAYPSLVVRSWDAFDKEVAQSYADKAVAMVLGPGFDANRATDASLIEAALSCPAALLIDGGALGMLTKDEVYARCRPLIKNRDLIKHPIVMTPHQGEAKRLYARIGKADAIGVKQAFELAEYYESLIVLKGPDTYIVSKDDTQPTKVVFGGAELAKAGSGDVLSGIIGAFLAQGTDANVACVLGVSLHAESGRIAADRKTEISVVPEDVAEAIPEAIKRYRLR